MSVMTKRNLTIAGLTIIMGFVALTLFLINKEPEEIVIDYIKEEAYTAPPPIEEKNSPITFREVTENTSITYEHYNGSFTTDDGEDSRFMPETMGPGVVLFDFDNDGDNDIFVTNSSDFDDAKKTEATAHLYRNDGELKFTDVTKDSGLMISSYSMGAVAADYNGDYYIDLLITTWGGPKLFKNNGDNSFSDSTDLLKNNHGDENNPVWSTGAVFFDADGDEDLDIYVANYVSWSPDSDLFSTIDGTRKSYATPDIYNGDSGQLYIQEDGEFLDQTKESGLYNPEGKSLGVALWDFDKDGKLDIAVANDTQPNFLYYNLGNGKYEDRGLNAGIAYDENGKTRAGMGIDIADYANDGSAGIAIGNFSHEPVSVFLQEGESFFRESSQQSGVAGPTYMALTFGLLFADFDLDGWQDLLMANGHIEPNIQEVEAEITYKQPLVLLGNTQDGKFTDWSDSAGEAFQSSIVGRGLATGDLDNDGDLDVVATENNGPIKIIINDADMTERHYVRIKLQGTPPNTDAIGALIEVTVDGVTQRRYVRNGSSYLSQTEIIQTFGLGGEDKLDKVSVRWPNGEKIDYDVPKVNSTLIISQDKNQISLVQD